MKRFLWAISVAVAAAAVHPPDACAQSGGMQHEREQFTISGPPLTLAEAIDEARQHNAEVAALRAQAGVLRERPAQARALPPLMLEATIWNRPINSVNPLDTDMYMFMATQELPRSGKRTLRAAAAASEILVAENDVQQRARGITAAVKETYTELAAARLAIAIHLDTIDLVRQIADIAQVKYETARISQKDVLKPVVELSRLHGDIAMLDQQARSAVLRLNALMGRSLDAPIGPLGDPVERTLAVSLDRLQEAALANEPALDGARLRTQLAEANLAAGREEYKADFGVQAGYMLQPRRTDGILARLTVTWPKAPWSRSGIDARVNEAGAAVQSARAQERAQETVVRLAVQEAYLRIDAAHARAELLRTTIVPQTMQALDVSRAAYQTDRADLLDVLDNERALLEARLAYYATLAELDRSFAELERLTGGL